ncbi:LamG-like jellyroll fold domain-containing protein [Promicromonospora sp. NFX87]|uniref:LamG-like jellyroll fold domain-containing protein n=1 Tax=Promicromonospora sp. NFX87 TaxID=3402691 RepID=UPI003AFAE587
MTTLPALLAPPALSALRDRLTLPFARGAELRELILAAGATPSDAVVVPYGFGEYLALYGREPQPSYVLRAVVPVVDGTTVQVTGTDPVVGPFTVTVTPGAAGDGDSFAVSLPPGATAAARLTSLTEAAVPAGDRAETRWALTALLGTTARMLWVIGAERDRLARLEREVYDQRTVARTGTAALDLVGADLAVPRFPPTPYSVDDATIALFHLDDEPGATPQVADAAALFPGRNPHHGALSGTPPTALPTAAPGRWRTGLHFGAGSQVTLAAHTDLNIGATRGWTVDFFVRPDPGSTLGTVVFRGPGSQRWAVEIGDTGLGGANSVRATVSDGATSLSATAAVDLPTDRFSHVAAVLARDGGTARLSVVVDGLERAVDAGPLGAVTGGGAVRLGPGGTGFRGTLDEVRFSTVARTHFHPALGESDESYRARLTLFRRWELPTPSGLQAALNRLVPVLDGVPEPLVVDDTDGAARGGGVVLRVWPRALALMESMDGDGRPGVREEEMWPRVDGAAQQALLGRCADPRVAFAPVAVEPDRAPGLPDPAPRRMRPAVAAALTRLADLFAAQGLAGVTVAAGWDAAAPGARADGRAVLLAAPGVGPGRLAALAHRAGFDLVEHRPRNEVYAAVAPGRALLLGPSGSGAQLQEGRTPRVETGTAVTVEASLGTALFDGATLPAEAFVRFSLLGAAPGTVLDQVAGAHSATLTPAAAGPLTLSADVTLAGRTTTTTVTLQVLPTPLPDGASVAADGTPGVSEDVVGTHPGFDPAYLGTITDPRVTLGPSPDDARVDRGLLAPLAALLDAFDEDGQVGSLAVVSAFRPAAPPGDLAREGRRLVLDHTVLGGGRLAIAAHAAGFAYVERDGDQVAVATPPGDPVSVTGPLELEVDETIGLTVDPDPAVVSATTRLGWSSAQVVPTAPDRQGVRLLSTTAPAVSVTGSSPGRTWVRATLREAGAAGPYAFEVRLRPELAAAHLSLDQYFLLMNALHTLHPVGVEVLTEKLRTAVVELSTAPGGIDPSFTYPTFRMHRPVRSLTKETPHG